MNTNFIDNKCRVAASHITDILAYAKYQVFLEESIITNCNTNTTKYAIKILTDASWKDVESVLIPLGYTILYAQDSTTVITPDGENIKLLMVVKFDKTYTTI